MKVAFLLSLSLFVCTTFALSGTLQTHDHGPWVFRQAGNDTWHNAKVPGVVHLDLMSNGIIPDPYYRDNVNAVQWVENASFVYMTEFVPQKELWAHSELNLIFSGLDTHATVWLNGKEILTADNMWKTWKVDVRSTLVDGKNNLTILFHSAVQHDNAAAEMMLPVVLPCENSRIYSRKAQYHYGWDWGPRLVTAGIWQSVHLEGWTRPRIHSAYFKTKSISKISASLDVEVDIERTSNVVDSYLITVEDENNKNVRASLKVDANGTSANKLTSKLLLTIPSPKLWWVRNLGSPHLYKFKVSVTQASNVIDQKTYKVGIRDVRLIQENDTIGRSFKVRLNGKDVFMKGANYIPPDMFLPRFTDDQYRRTIKDAVEGNYNMMRVWGGGTYEKDIFYDLCDEHGILLFHDLMFAGGMYPGNASFVKSVEDELTEQITRLRNHASIAFWAGNNEIQEGWDNWGWQQNLTTPQQELVYSWFEVLFKKLAPSVISKVDPNRDYVFTSPRYGYGHNISLIIGDSHYWAVWVLLNDIEIFNTAYGRFSSEFGMQGSLSFNSWQNFSLPSDWNISTPTMQAHQRHVAGYKNLDHFMTLYYKPLTYKSQGEWLEKYAYGTQVLQKYAMKIAIESHRRNQPHSMGTLVWQLNDVWPVISWSSVDSYGNWKALHYAERKLFENVLISFYTDPSTQTVKVYIVNDNLNNVKGNLRLELLDFQGKVYYRKGLSVIVQERASQNVLSIPVADLQNSFKDGVLNTSAVLRARFEHSVNKATENLYYFARPIALELPKPTIKVEIKKAGDEKNKNGVKIVLTSDKLAQEVYLFHNGSEGRFSDNFFDLLPNKPKVIYSHNLSYKEAQNLKVLSLYDTYN
jgi:beta-mannosidase